MSKVLDTIKSAASKAALGVKKHSPELLVIAGIGGLITATVLACRASTHVEEITSDARDALDDIAKREADTITAEEARKETVAVYTKAGIRFAKLYGPAVILGSLSIGAILQSHNILKKRNLALASAYTTLDKSFKQYKERVIERYGEETEREIAYGFKNEKLEKTEVDEEGHKKKVKETITGIDPAYGPISPYAKFFDESCYNWSKDPDQNLTFLRQAEQYANNRLRARGHITLNEIYEYLGLPLTNSGMLIGWLYRPGDNAYANYVDFGIYNVHRKSNRDFVNGYERCVLLDFNPDGNIYGSFSVDE